MDGKILSTKGKEKRIIYYVCLLENHVTSLHSSLDARKLITELNNTNFSLNKHPIALFIITFLWINKIRVPS